MGNNYTQASKQASNSFLKLTIFVTALVLCLWTTSFTLIANFAPSGAAVSRYYCEVDSAGLLLDIVEEVNILTNNTTAENSAVIKLIDDIELNVTYFGVDINIGNVLFAPDKIFNSMDEKAMEELQTNPQPVAFFTLDLNGHVLTLDKFLLGCTQYIGLEIIDSNPTAENVLPDGTTVTGGAIYGDDEALIMSYGYLTINGGNFCGDMAILTAEGDLTINQGTYRCHSTGLGFINESFETANGSIIIVDFGSNVTPSVNINGGQIDYPIAYYECVNDGEFAQVTDPEVVAQYVIVDEKNVDIIKDDAGNIIGYAEKVIEPEPTPTPEDPENPDEQDPTEDPKPDDNKNDNKTPVISGTTDNGQPTSDDFMKIMMIGILVIVALSVISIAASLLIIKKYRPRVA